MSVEISGKLEIRDNYEWSDGTYVDGVLLVDLLEDFDGKKCRIRYLTAYTMAGIDHKKETDFMEGVGVLEVDRRSPCPDCSIVEIIEIKEDLFYLSDDLESEDGKFVYIKIDTL